MCECIADTRASPLLIFHNNNYYDVLLSTSAQLSVCRASPRQLCLFIHGNIVKELMSVHAPSVMHFYSFEICACRAHVSNCFKKIVITKNPNKNCVFTNCLTKQVLTLFHNAFYALLSLTDSYRFGFFDHIPDKYLSSKHSY